MRSASSPQEYDRPNCAYSSAMAAILAGPAGLGKVWATRSVTRSMLGREHPTLEFRRAGHRRLYIASRINATVALLMRECFRDFLSRGFRSEFNGCRVNLVIEDEQLLGRHKTSVPEADSCTVEHISLHHDSISLLGVGPGDNSTGHVDLPVKRIRALRARQWFESSGGPGREGFTLKVSRSNKRCSDPIRG